MREWKRARKFGREAEVDGVRSFGYSMLVQWAADRGSRMHTYTGRTHVRTPITVAIPPFQCAPFSRSAHFNAHVSAHFLSDSLPSTANAYLRGTHFFKRLYNTNCCRRLPLNLTSNDIAKSKQTWNQLGNRCTKFCGTKDLVIYVSKGVIMGY